MSKQVPRRSNDIAERGIRYTRDQIEEVVAQTEKYVRANPVRSIAYAVAAGFILDRLPVCRVLGGVTRLSVAAFKPAILVYGATKLYQILQENQR